MGNISHLWVFLVIVAGTGFLLDAAQPPRVRDSKCPLRTYSIRVATDYYNYRELYRVCYNFTNRMAFYAQHKIYAFQKDTPNLSSPPYFAPAISAPCHGYVWANNSLLKDKHVRNLDSTKISDYLNTLLKWRPSYDHGHLVPCADFTQPYEQEATYQVVNAVPQLSSLNQGAWRSVEAYLRRSAENGPVMVVTGVLGELQHNSKTIHLINDKYVSIPEFIYKVADVPVPSDTNITFKLHTFIAYNGYEAMDPLRLALHCIEVLCPRRIPRIYCCDPSEFIRRNLPGFKEFFYVV